MKKFIYIIASLCFVLVFLKLFVFSGDKVDNITDDRYYKAFDQSYKIFAPRIPEKLDFADEAVPVNIYYIREGLDREILVNTYWHSNTLLLFKRAFRWFPIIEPILKENKVPDDFKYLALIESGLMNVTSPSGAKGFWQFMKSTATSYDLEVSSEVDERYNLEKSTVAACKYLKDAYAKYGSWTVAAASYNMGMGGISGKLKEQKQDNYYDLLLNAETSRYIYRILAVKLIFEQPTKYGFYLRKKDLYPPIPTEDILVDTAITNLIDFAIANKINYKVLKDLNPWLRDSKLLNKDKKTYKIKIPKASNLNYSVLQKEFINDTLIYKDTITFDVKR